MKNSVVIIVGAVVLAVGLIVGIVTAGKQIQVNVQVQGGLSGVVVQVDDQTKKTDDTGSVMFDLKSKENDEVRIEFSKQYYSRFDTIIVVGLADSYTISGVVLMPQEVSIPLKVVAQQENLEPVEAAVFINGQPWAATDSSGQLERLYNGPYGQKITLSVEGSSKTQELEINPDLTTDLAPFVVSSGLSVMITTVNEVGGVEISVGNKVFGHTDDKGQATVSLPASKEDQTLAFKLSGARIANFTIPAQTIQAEKTLKHRLKIEPLGSVKLQVSAFTEDSSQESVIGFNVKVNGEKVGETDGDGTFSHTLRPLVGERINVEVSQGKLGSGSVAVRIRPGELEYSARVGLIVPIIVRIIAVDELGERVSGVQVIRDGSKVGKTNTSGEIEVNVARQGVIYRFDLSKPGYTCIDCLLSVQPEHTETEREVVMETLYFLATFIDEISNDPVYDLEIFYQGSLVAITEGGAVQISVSDFGVHELELRSQEEGYPKSQKVSVEVGTNGEDIEVPVKPLPREFALRFVWAKNQKPIKDREVTIKGGYIARGNTDENGQVVFSSHSIEQGQEYEVILKLPGGEVSFEVTAHSYKTVQTYDVAPKTKIYITTPGHENAHLQIFKKRRDYAQKKPALLEGTGVLEGELPYGAYFLIAKDMPGADSSSMETTKEDKLNLRTQTFELEVDLSDPYIRAEKLYQEGDIPGAMVIYREVWNDHPKYHEAQVKLGFYNLEQGKNDAAATFFGEALAPSVQFRADPHIYLGSAQAHHRAGKYDVCMDHARAAFRYKNLVPANKREEKESHANYLSILCEHDKYFKSVRNSEEIKDDYEQQLDILQNIMSKWDDYISNYENFPRDGERRRTDVITAIGAL